jgi:hypothetical protein
MRYSVYRQHLIRPLVYLLALAHLFSAPLCFAKEKKQGAKRYSFPKAKICATTGFESEPDDLPYEEVVSEYLGMPYRRGGTGSNGIDCSGLSRKFYLEIYGVDLPHSSREQCSLNIFEKVPLDTDAFESKDLLFFRNKNRRINHVGIYLEDGKFLHASPNKGVMISSLGESYWKNRLVASRRIKDTVLAKASGAGSSDQDETNAHKTNEITMGYAADINGALHVDLETFYSNPFSNQNLVKRQTTDLFADGSLYLADVGSEPWQGVRASTSIYPAQWLRITPSLGMLNGPSWFTRNNDNTWQVYGLETAVSPLSSRWSLVFSMQSLLNDSYFAAYDDATDTDIGLHFNYWVSNTLRVSVMGNWEGSYLMQNAQADNLARDLLTLNLDFSF